MNATYAKGALLALLIACAAPVTFGAQVLYTEGWDGGSSSNVVDYGWHYYVGYNDSTLYDENSWAGVASVNTGSGYVFVGGGGSGNELLFYTNEFVIDRSLFQALNMSWVNDGDTTEQYRAAVRIGGQWYTNTTAQAAVNGPITFSLDTNTSLLNVDSSGISLGAAMPLPDGNIDAFGMLFVSQVGNVRYDSALVSGTRIPEPASALVVLAGLGAAGLRSRGRSRR